MKEVALLQESPSRLKLTRMEPLIEAAPQSDRLDFSALLSAVRRHWWLFLGVSLGIFALSIVVTLIWTPSYTATARVAINTQQVQVTPTSISGTADAPVVSSVPSISSAIDTEVTVIGSRKVAERVVAALHLEQDPEFSLANAETKVGALGKIKHAVAGFVKSLLPAASAPPVVSPHDYTINSVLSSLTIARFNLTNSIDISFEDEDSTKSATIANEFSKQYIEYQIASKSEGGELASAFLQDRLNQMLTQYLADTQKVQQYKIAHNLMSAGATTLTEQEIANYNQTVATAKAEVAADDANLSTARDQLAHGSSGADVGEALSSGVIQALRAQRATVSEHLADLQGRYGEKYPELAIARRQLADMDEQIQAEINRVISNLEAKAQVSRQRLSSIQGTLASTKGELAQNNESQVGLNQLQQAADASQALYQSYLSRLKETAAQAGGELPDARVLSGAAVPTSPSEPIVLLNLALGLVLGVGFGLIAILVSEWLDSSLATADDVESKLGQRYLGGIPELSSVQKRNRKFPLVAMVTDPHSAYAEAFRNLRAAIGYSVPGGGRPSVVMVSSALPREGKTTAAIGLARTAALQGQSTLLIDCDMRRRGLNQIISSKDQKPGLIEVLLGKAKLEDAIVVDEESGASLLPINRTREPATDLFSGQEMAHLIQQARERFQFVILDGPPLLPVADSRMIAPIADAVVLVTRWRKTDIGAIRAALRMLPPEYVVLAGVAITRIDMRKQAKFGHGDPGFYYNQYRSYYG